MSAPTAIYQIEADQGSNIGIGGIYAFPINKIFQFYPVMTIESTEVIESK